jgi:uncharacterized membrane protein
MDNDKQRQEVSLIGRIFSMEALIFVMGCLSLYYGITQKKTMNIFWAVIILCGFFILRKVRKKDWKKHWEDMEAEKQAREAYAKRKASGDTPPEK